MKCEGPQHGFAASDAVREKREESALLSEKCAEPLDRPLRRPPCPRTFDDLLATAQNVCSDILSGDQQIVKRPETRWLAERPIEGSL